MKPFDEAHKIMMDSARVLDSERVGFDNILNRILAVDIVSDIAMPPFDKSARDGYACRRQDLDNELEIIEMIPAGYVPQKSIGNNQCAKIMTGAIVPGGADCVVMVEFSENPTDNTVRVKNKDEDNHIYFKGEDIKTGDVVISKGTQICPQHIAILAAVGCTNPLVAIRPKIGIIATGNEIIEPDMKPNLSQIRNSNSYQLQAQLNSMGVMSKYYGIAKDTEQVLDNIFKKAVSENDVVLISGGVSMGDFDIVPEIVEKNGIEILFHKVAIKPGKPTLFATSGNKLVFGMPGNPVSTFVIFELFVKKFLFAMMGHDYKHNKIKLPLLKSVSRQKSKRLEWIPAKISGNGVIPIEYHGSGHITALSDADGFFSIQVGVSEMKIGTIVNVMQIR